MHTYANKNIFINTIEEIEAEEKFIFPTKYYYEYSVFHNLYAFARYTHFMYFLVFKISHKYVKIHSLVIRDSLLSLLRLTYS